MALAKEEVAKSGLNKNKPVNKLAKKVKITRMRSIRNKIRPKKFDDYEMNA